MSTHVALSTSAIRECFAAPVPVPRRKEPVKWLMSGLTASILGLTAAPAQAITVYDITQIGLVDVGHTRNDGYQYNQALFLNNAGDVLGRALRFNYGEPGTGCYDCGESVWVYNGSGTQEIGLTGGVHTRNDGYQYNRPEFFNNAGQVAGTANRYTDPLQISLNETGQSAWFYNGSSTQQIGLTDAVHTSGSNGVQYNWVWGLNSTGQVVGTADRSSGGQSTWIFNGSSTQQIGLTDVGHTNSSNGYQFNASNMINNVGQAAGYAERYSGSVSTGYSAWRYSGGATQEIGLTDPDHTGPIGARSNFAQLLNNAGQVAGTADRYRSDGVGLGKSAWRYSGGSTQEIGLTDAGHTNSDGVQINQVGLINESGQVVGIASRYNGSWSNTGQSAWIYNGSSTQEIGLIDAGHTGGGYRYNEGRALNNAGQVAGEARRFNGLSDAGQSAWLYKGGSTQEIGLTDAGHTSGNGTQFNYALFLNETGQVAGRAIRFNGDTQTGQSAWLYDSTTNQSYNMDFSVSLLDGYAYSNINYLGEDGLALGVYTLYDAGGSSLGNHAFSFTVADGLTDLGSMVDGGLNTAGWGYLANAYRANGAGQIIGQGVLTGMSGQAAYLLAPVPEPETWAMLLTGLGLVGMVVRRRKSCHAV